MNIANDLNCRIQSPAAFQHKPRVKMLDIKRSVDAFQNNITGTGRKYHHHRKVDHAREQRRSDTLNLIKDSLKDIKNDHDELNKKFRTEAIIEGTTAGINFVIGALAFSVYGAAGAFAGAVGLILSVISGFKLVKTLKNIEYNDARYEQAKKEFKDLTRIARKTP